MRFFLTIVALVNVVISFTQTKDANFWTSAGVKLEITDNFDFSYEKEFRFYKNATSLDSYINQIGFGYEPIKNLTFDLDYRYSRKNEETHFEGVNRLALNASYNVKFDNLGLKLKGRLRYQVPFNRLGVINDAIYPDNRNVVRFKISAKHTPVNLKKIEPFCSYEFYKAVNPKNIYGFIDSYRVCAGVSFNLPKRQEVEIYYIFESENRSIPRVNHIYAISYSFRIFKDPLIQNVEAEGK